MLNDYAGWRFVILFDTFQCRIRITNIIEGQFLAL